MLAAIDSAGTFPIGEGDGVLFVLIDGHHSNPAHLWKVCIWVPYATHMWQPHDSSELNGLFKTKLYKTRNFTCKKTLSPCNIILILNKCWPTTHGNATFAKKALLARGWSVLNCSYWTIQESLIRVILMHSQPIQEILLQTMPYLILLLSIISGWLFPVHLTRCWMIHCSMVRSVY
jgi:hypothetical protein